MSVWQSAGVLGFAGAAILAFAPCEYAGLARPSVLGQVDPEMAALLNELPNLEEPNEALVVFSLSTGRSPGP